MIGCGGHSLFMGRYLRNTEKSFVYGTKTCEPEKALRRVHIGICDTCGIGEDIRTVTR